MRKKLVAIIITFAGCVMLAPSFAMPPSRVCSLGALGAEASTSAPKSDAPVAWWASILPQDAVIVVAVEDVERFTNLLFPLNTSGQEFPSLEQIVAVISELDPKARPGLEGRTVVLKTFLEALKGSFAVSLAETPQWPTVVFVGNLRPEARDFSKFVLQKVKPLLDSLQIKSVLDEDQGVHHLRIGDFAVHFSASDSLLFASTDVRALLAMKERASRPEPALSGKESFRKAAAAVPPAGLFVFMDVGKFVRLHFVNVSSGTCKALSNLGLDRLESFVLSANIAGSFLALDFALTSDGELVGLPAIVLRPNTPTRAAKFVPSDYSAFKRFSVAGALDAYREWQATVRRLVDDVSWKEYQDSLAKLKEERGFSLDDILQNLGEEVAFAVNLPELLGIPPTLVLVGVKDEAKALELIRSILTRADAEPLPSKAIHGAIIYTTALIPGVFLSYAAKDNYLIIGLAPSSVAAALDASESGKSLAGEPQFVSAVNSAPKENLLFAYTDIRRLAGFAATSLPWLHSKLPSSQLALELAKGADPKDIAQIVQILHLESKQLGAATAHATSHKDCLSLRVNVPMKVMSLLASEQLIAPSIRHAQEKARRVLCLNNLKQIALACYQYANEHDGKFPDKLSEVYPYVGSLEPFSCPSSGTLISDPSEIDSKSSYKLVGGFVLKDVKQTSEKLVLYESLDDHKVGANVAFADGHVRWVTAEAFRELLKEAGL